MTEILLPRTREAATIASDRIERVTKEAGWSDDDVLRVVLALGEAIANAVEHGPAEHPDPIRLSVWVRAGQCVLSIDDGGPGPRPSAIDQATLPASLLATDGRGLYMMRELSDAVEVENGVVRLRFSKQS